MDRRTMITTLWRLGFSVRFVDGPLSSWVDPHTGMVIVLDGATDHVTRTVWVRTDWGDAETDRILRHEYHHAHHQNSAGPMDGALDNQRCMAIDPRTRQMRVLT